MKTHLPLSLNIDPNSMTLYNYDQLAQILQKSKATIQREVYKGDIPYLKIGRHVRFDPLQIREWLLSKSKNKPGMC